MNQQQKRYGDILSNCLSGNRWEHFLTVILGIKAIAVYIYIIIIIILCYHVTIVTTETIYTYRVKIDICSFVVVTVGSVVTSVYWCCFLKNRSGNKVVTGW